MNLYFISGLGADEKAFARINLKGVTITHVNWVEHSSNDSISTYAKKLISQIDTSKPYLIVALSFGGIIAQELNTFIKPEKTIIISSVTHQKQFPWFYQIGKIVVPLTPNFIFRKTNAFINYLFGAKGKNAKVLANIMEANDPLFVKWCVVQLLKWKKTTDTSNLISIHGTNDKIIPYHECDYTIQDGSHFMVYSQAKDVQTILQLEIDKLI